MTSDTGHMYTGTRLSSNTGRSKNRDRGRRLTHLAEFDMWAVLALDPGLLELEDRVVDIGMIVEILVLVGLIIKLSS